MPQNFTFNRKQADGNYQPEKVSLERWRWRATYESGLVFNQFDFDTLSFHQFAEIDQAQVRVWQLVNDTAAPVTFIVEPGDKLIHAYRNLGFDYMGAHDRVRLYVLGLVRGGQKTVAVVTPENEVVITDEADKLNVEGA